MDMERTGSDVRIALMQVITGRDVAANLELVRDWTERAAREGAELVVFPEATMRAFGNSLIDIAEPASGPFATGVGAVARQFGVTIALGMFTPGEAGRVRNTLLVAGPDGVLAGYDKIHLFDAFGFAESDTVTPGSQPTVVTIGDTQVGLAICYDVRFPNLFVRLAGLGARVIILPASWGAGLTEEDRAAKLEQWRLLTRARALDSTCFVVAVGQGDPRTLGWQADPQKPGRQADPQKLGRQADPRKPGGAPTGIGHSMAIGPDGEVLCELGDGQEFRVVEIDPGRTDAVRAVIPVLANRRI